MIKKIYKKISQHPKIIIARHIGPDPDALASQIALRDSIAATFPDKEVYAVGAGAARFAYFGKLNKIEESQMSDALLIALDVPDKKRIDCFDVSLAKEIIKIDHHPFIEKYAALEWIDETASSTAEMIVRLIFTNKLTMNKNIAKNLFMGIVADSNRFLFTNNSPAVFRTAADLIEKTDLDISKLYDKVYERSLVEMRFQSYIGSNFKITENGLAYIFISDEELKKYQVDPATAGNMINNFNYIKEVLIWVIFSEDKVNNNIRASIRSRGPVINDVATIFGGGGHELASGAKLQTQEQIKELIEKLEERLKENS